MRTQTWKQAILVIVVTALASTPVFASGQSEGATGSGGPSFNRSGYPVVDETYEISIVAIRNAFHTKPFDELALVRTWEEMTNIHVSWIEVGDDSYTERKNLIFASGDLPDAFMRGITQQDEMQYGANQGLLIPLEGLVDEYAPQISAVFEQYPEVRRLATTPDGHMYSLPQFAMNGIMNAGDNMFINQAWLDELGLEIPTTTDEFVDVLRAFRDQDPNGNGEADEIPFSFVYNGWFAMQYWSLFGAFGRLNRPNLMVAEDGDAVFTADKREYRATIEWFAEMYAEGLLDIETFTQNGSQLKAKGTGPDNELGSFIAFWRQNAVNPDRVDDYAVLPPLEGPNGDRQWNRWLNDLGRGGFSITSAAESPEIITRWIDMIGDQEWSMSVLYGPKGYGWDEEADGTLVLLAPPDVSFDEHKHSESLANAGVKMVTSEFLSNLYYEPGDPTLIKLQDADAYEPFQPSVSEVLPDLYFTAEQADELALITVDIQDYVRKKAAEWISGAADIDAEWNEYVRTLGRMGLDRYVEIYNDAYDAYLANL